MGEGGASTAGNVVGILLIIISVPAIFLGIMLASVPPGGVIGFPILFVGLIMLLGGGLLIHSSQKKPSTPPAVTPPPIQPVSTSGTAAISSAQTPTRIIQPSVPSTKVALAYLEAPNGRLIVSSIDQPFYRNDFVGLVSPGLLDTISQSKPQFIIRFRGGRFYIEDPGSTNGTLLNGRQIRGMGMQELRDGDIISPAGTINLVFRAIS